MNRLAGIIVAALGLIVAVISILKVIPGFSLTGTGVLMLVTGGAMIGLSFVSKPLTEGVERMSTGSSLINIFVAPAEVFQNLRRHPRWLIAVLIMAILSSVYTNLFVERLTVERVANYTIDKTLEMPMIANSDQATQQVESGRAKAVEDAKNPVNRIGQAINGFLGIVLLNCVLAGIFLLFALAMGGSLNFWQAFAAAVYAAFPVSIIRFVLNTVILYIKDPTDIHPIRGQSSLIQDNLSFLVTPADHPVIFSFLAALGLLWFYWTWLNATGLKNAGERVSGSTAWTAALAIYGILVLFGVVLSWAFPSFIS